MIEISLDEGSGTLEIRGRMWSLEGSLVCAV